MMRPRVVYLKRGFVDRLFLRAQAGLFAWAGGHNL